MQYHYQAEKRAGMSKSYSKNLHSLGHSPLPKHKRGELELAQ